MPKVTSGTHDYGIYGATSNIRIIDTAKPFLKYLAAGFPNEFRRAIKSAGWWLSREIKAGIRSGAPGGQRYKDFSGIKNLRDVLERRKIKKMGKRGKLILKGATHQKQNKLARETRTHRPLGKLANAIGYKYYADGNRVLVGWLSKAAAELGLKMEQGYEYPVTPKMRKLFAAAGMPLTKKALMVPKRPTIEPMYRTKGPQVFSYVENKIWESIRKAEAKTA